jgi:hypothetical protein
LQLWACWRTRHCSVHIGQSGVPCRPLELPRVAHRFRGRPLALVTVGSPDSPVHHRTVRCTTGQSGAPPDSPVNFSRTPLILFPRATSSPRMTHGQSGAPPDGPMIFSHTPSSNPESGEFTRTNLAHRTLSGAPPDSPVCQAELEFGCAQPSLLQFDSLLLSTVSST